MKRQVASSTLDAYDQVKENLPISAISHRNHGAIVVDKPVENGTFSKQENGVVPPVKAEKTSGKSPEKAAKELEPLSIPRKIGFVMSFSVIALYFAVFLYFIPCKTSNCHLEETWTLPVKGIHVTTDLKYLENDALGAVMMFGYSNNGNMSFGKEWGFAVVDANTGYLVWKKMLPFQPRHFKCYLNSENETTSCLAVGYSDLTYFNVSNGHIYWNRRFSPDVFPENVLPELFRTSNVSYIVYAADRTENGVYLNAVDLDTGFKFASALVPCEQLPVRMQKLDERGNLLLACSGSLFTDIWVVPPTAFVGEEGELEKKHIALSSKLKDVSGLVKIIPTGNDTHVVLTNNAVMITSSSSAEVTWISGLDNFTVIDAVVGRFLSEGGEVAVLLEDAQGNTVVRVLKLSNGASVSSASISGRRPSAPLLRLPLSGGAAFESLLAKTESGNRTAKLDHEMNELDQWHGLNHGDEEDRLVDYTFYAVKFAGVSASATPVLDVKAAMCVATVADNHLLVAIENEVGVRIVQYRVNDLTSTCAS